MSSVWTPTRQRLLGIAVVALAQTAVLAYMVADRVHLLRTGREIALPIEPVDPRDLFRGDYVSLGYGISWLSSTLTAGTPIDKRGATLYVVLEKGADGAWSPIAVSARPPGRNDAEHVVLKGRAATQWPSMRVRYGIESYFVPQGEGRRLEALARERKLAALIAVDEAGNAAIKGLIIDGKLQYEEPLL
jgi:uncharacterized membrane-anchored protein